MDFYDCEFYILVEWFFFKILLAKWQVKYNQQQMNFNRNFSIIFIVFYSSLCMH